MSVPTHPRDDAAFEGAIAGYFLPDAHPTRTPRPPVPPPPPALRPTPRTVSRRHGRTSTMAGRARTQRDLIIEWLIGFVGWPVTAFTIGWPGVLAWTGVMCFCSAYVLAVVHRTDRAGTEALERGDHR